MFKAHDNLIAPIITFSKMGKWMVKHFALSSYSMWKNQDYNAGLLTLTSVHSEYGIPSWKLVFPIG